MALKFYLDETSSAHIRGWAFHESGDPVLIEVEGPAGLIARTTPDLARPDVAAAFPHEKAALNSGFDLALNLDRSSRLTPVRLRMIAGSDHLELGPDYRPGDLFSLTFLGPAGANQFATGLGRVVTPLPKEIAAGIMNLWPELETADWASETIQDIAIDRIGSLLYAGGALEVPSLTRYARYLNDVWRHFQFVDRYFPALNQNVSCNAKDRLCKASTPGEMMNIANHLYVLRSYGVAGDFAEFGCFKGFSTSMLSYACNLLNIKFHVFDSFQGLPDSDSEYYRVGDFQGSLADVTKNVELYGSLESVSFHPGFFSEALKTFSQPLISIWMDVDLDSSARDVMSALGLVDGQGAVFSHECQPRHFDGGRIIPARGPEEVVGEIVDAFEAKARKITGRMVTGYTGAFWDSVESIPPLAQPALTKLIQLITR
jgi:O-methyltransferase